MRYTTLLALAAVANVNADDHGPTYGGTGPYKSYSFEVPTLVNHTFYQPLESAVHSDLKLPVIIWGNGGCKPWSYESTGYTACSLALIFVLVGSAFRALLGEVTSYGALAIATGPLWADPETDKQTEFDPNNLGENPAALTAAIDWVYTNAGKGDWRHIDKTRIGVWGQSCGGLEAYSAGIFDSRVGHLGIFNSGQLNQSTSTAVAGALKKPVFWLLGGPTDVAYPNGERDYVNLAKGTPAWKGNHDLGHSAAFDAPNSGIPGIVGRYAMQWLLRGEIRAKQWFTGPGPKSIGVSDVEYKPTWGSINITAI